LQWGRVDLERGRIKIGKDKTQAGTGRVVPLNARALETLKFWANQFPDRKPEHYVFPIERYGLHGKKGTFGGVVKAYDIDPTHPVGTIQSAWESAKRRTQRRCPNCAAGTLADSKAEGYTCDRCHAELEKLPEGLTRFRFHDLRHTAVSRMIAAGQPLPIIAKVVG
jgi:integrase